MTLRTRAQRNNSSTTSSKNGTAIRRLFDDEASLMDEEDYEDDDEIYDDDDDDDDYEDEDSSSSFISKNDDVEDLGSGSSDEENAHHEHQEGASNSKLSDSIPNNNSTSTTVISTNAVKRGRGRPPKDAAAPGTTNSTPTRDVPTTKPPGHHTFPINDFSLTITKTGGDIELYIMDKVHDFIVTYALKGGISTEVGHKVHNLHLQGMFSIRYPKDKKHLVELVKLIKALIKPLTGYKVMLKPFATNQNFSAMLGYITKDQGKSCWY